MEVFFLIFPHTHAGAQTHALFCLLQVECICPVNNWSQNKTRAERILQNIANPPLQPRSVCSDGVKLSS